MTNKMHNPNSNKRSAATMAALSAMLACQACPGQAFQPSTFLLSQPTMHLGLAGSATPLTMGCPSPWDPCYSTGPMQPFRDPMSTFVRWPRAMRGPMISVPSRPGVFHDDFHLEVANPEVQDTDQEYMLIFRLPEGVDKEDFDVAVSGHLLTVKATTTREQSGDGRSRGGWVSRSSRTDSVSRSFVLPEGVSSSGVSTRKGDDGKVEVRFNKVIGGSNDDTVDSSQAQTADGSSSSATAAADASRGGSNAEGADASSPLPNQESSSVRGDERGRPRSLFDAVFDEDFGDLATLMWGEDPFRFPTREEMAARAETARKERAERVRSMRRSRMATDVSEKDGSYVVRMALPEGTTRDDVTLTVTPDKALRVSVSREGRRSLARDVRLPRDALFSEISAKFDAEEEEAVEDGDEGSGGVPAESVCGLDVKVGKAAPPEPIRVDIE